MSDDSHFPAGTAGKKNLCGVGFRLEAGFNRKKAN